VNLFFQQFRTARFLQCQRAQADFAFRSSLFYTGLTGLSPTLPLVMRFTAKFRDLWLEENVPRC
jgi:hypothetical protein